MRSIYTAVLFSLAFACLPVLGQQSLIPDSPLVSIATDDQSKIRLLYSDSSGGVNALTVKVFFNGQYLSLSKTNFYPNGFLGSSVFEDNEDIDANPSTTHYLMMSWIDLALEHQWPDRDEQLELAGLTISATKDFSSETDVLFPVSELTIIRDEQHSNTESEFVSHYLFVNQASAGNTIIEFTDNTAPVIANYNLNTGEYSLSALDGSSTVTFSGDYSNAKIYLLPDIDGDGSPEYGLLGTRASEGNEGRTQLKVVDALSGNAVATYNWVANWVNVKFVALPDMNGDGYKEVAIQGSFKEGNRPQLLVRDGLTGRNYQTFSFPDLWFEPQYMPFTDVTGDGVVEIALFGRIKRNNKPQVKVVDGTNRARKLKAYTFPDKWADVSWNSLGDVNGDGFGDWGLYGVRKTDESPQLIVKDGTNPKGALAIFTWPSDMMNPSFLQMADANNDGVDEFATSGYRLAANRYQLILKNGADRSKTLLSMGWPANWEEVSFINVGDFNDNGYDDLALLGRQTSTDAYQLVIRNGGNADEGVTSSIIDTWNLGTDWKDKPRIYVNSNGESITLIAFGLNQAGEIVSLEHTYSE